MSNHLLAIRYSDAPWVVERDSGLHRVVLAATPNWEGLTTTYGAIALAILQKLSTGPIWLFGVFWEHEVEKLADEMNLRSCSVTKGHQLAMMKVERQDIDRIRNLMPAHSGWDGIHLICCEPDSAPEHYLQKCLVTIGENGNCASLRDELMSRKWESGVVAAVLPDGYRDMSLAIGSRALDENQLLSLVAKEAGKHDLNFGVLDHSDLGLIQLF